MPMKIPQYLSHQQPAKVTYTNYRGETSERSIIPVAFRFCETTWHPEKQWIIHAWDVDKGAYRDFALKDFGEPAGRITELETKNENLAQLSVEEHTRAERGAYLLKQVRDACLIGDDDGISVTEDPHIHAELFAQINDFVRASVTGASDD